jgi:hypothetical protein
MSYLSITNMDIIEFVYPVLKIGDTVIWVRV